MNKHGWFKLPGRIGDRTVKSQVKGLGVVDFAGKTVLDCGCAEAQISKYALIRGAKSVLGLEITKEFVEEARRQCEGLKTIFFHFDLNNFNADEFGMFDTVLLLSIVHKLKEPLWFLEEVINSAKDIIVIRLPDRVLNDWRSPHIKQDIPEFMAKLGFDLIAEPKTCIEPVSKKQEYMCVLKRRV